MIGKDLHDNIVGHMQQLQKRLISHQSDASRLLASFVGLVSPLYFPYHRRHLNLFFGL